MDINEKTIKEIAAQLGLSGNQNVNSSMIRKLEQKSDAQIAADILRLKEELKANNISTEQQLAVIKQLMPMLDSKQKARLQKVIELLK